MKKAISILGLTLAAAASLTACSKSSEQNVVTENVSNSIDLGIGENVDDSALNSTNAADLENASNTAL